MVRYPKFESVLFVANSQSYSMISSGSVRFLRLTGLVSLQLAVAVTLLRPLAAQAQVPSLPPSGGQAQPLDPNDPNNIRPLSQAAGLLSMQGGQRLMDEASNAVSAQNYTLATQKLQEARQVYNQLSNFYQDLASSFSGIDNRVADGQRRKALDAAQMRDQATYQLALVHRAQNQPELAVPLLVQIIRSQQPTRDLGKKAYQQLFELGFVDAQFPRSSGGQQSSTPAPAPSP